MTIKQQGGIFGRNPTFNDVATDTLDVTTSLSSPLIDTLRVTDDGSAGLRLYSTMANGTGIIVYANIIYPSGNTGATANNFVDLGSAGVRFKDIYAYNVKLANGGGIDFSATSGTGTSELFNDYEEGTWSPTFSATGLSGVTIGGGTAGYYTKVGNKVIAWFSIYTTGTFTKGSAALFIAGLPYTSANNAGGQGAVSFHNATRFDALPPIAARVDSNSTSIKLYSSINATGAGTDPVAVSSSNMRSAAAENCNFVSGTVTYMV